MSDDEQDDEEAGVDVEGGGVAPIGFDCRADDRSQEHATVVENLLHGHEEGHVFRVVESYD